MKNFNIFTKKQIFGIPKRYLLLVAASFWTFAGCMLLFRGFSLLNINSDLKKVEVLCSLVFGILFYSVLFSKISFKHINRILSLPHERPSFFSFFNGRSYLLMTIMISFGIALRLSGIIPIIYLSLFYITMGVPLLISSVRFYYNFLFFEKRKFD